jgi:tetratricopeptide (TPR) repeat protein
VAAGQIIDEDADLAMQHAIAARRLASRIAVVREAVGLAAYAAGDWPTAIAELRTYHRMTGRQTHLAELADCERALGRPERAIDLYRGADRDSLDKAGAIELLIVAAGARGDLGQHDAAVAMLQVRELTADEDAEWAARLRYAYADALLAAGRREEAREWFARAAAADTDDLTDAAERLLELDGVTLDDDSDDDDEDDEQAGDSPDDDDPAAELDDESDDDESDEDDDEDEISARVDSEPAAELDDESEDDESGEDEDDDIAARVDTEPVTELGDEDEDGTDSLVGEDPADQDVDPERDDAARSRALTFVDGVETALNDESDLDDTSDADADSDAEAVLDGDSVVDRVTDGLAGPSGGTVTDAAPEADDADEADVPEPLAPVAVGDDEKVASDEFVAEAVEEIDGVPGEKRPPE